MNAFCKKISKSDTKITRNGSLLTSPQGLYLGSWDKVNENVSNNMEVFSGLKIIIKKDSIINISNSYRVDLDAPLYDEFKKMKYIYEYVDFLEFGEFVISNHPSGGNGRAYLFKDEKRIKTNSESLIYRDNIYLFLENMYIMGYQIDDDKIEFSFFNDVTELHKKLFVNEQIFNEAQSKIILDSLENTSNQENNDFVYLVHNDTINFKKKLLYICNKLTGKGYDDNNKKRIEGLFELKRQNYLEVTNFEIEGYYRDSVFYFLNIVSKFRCYGFEKGHNE